MRSVLMATLAFLMFPTLAAADMISGTVTYLQRMMLPPGTVVEVVLQDTSRADAPAKTLSTYVIEDAGAPPYKFGFSYDPATFSEQNTYTLRATATNGGQLLMTTDTAYPVVTRGAPTEVEMVMKMVEKSSDATAKPDSDFVNTYWKVLTLNGTSVEVKNNQKEPHLILNADGSYNATAGCNMIRGGYDLDGAKVNFKPGPSTMMACIPPLDAYEANLKQVLETAASFGVSGEAMELLDASGGTLATFKAVDLQ